MPHDTWRLLIDTAERGATNMARDEAIARHLREPPDPSFAAIVHRAPAMKRVIERETPPPPISESVPRRDGVAMGLAAP